MDISEKMLEGARRRFQGNANVRYVVADYSTYQIPESYDIVISALSIHHLPHPAKRQLFANLYRVLRDGGIFVNADQVRGHTDGTDAFYRKRWLEQIHQSGLPINAINASVERRTADINAKLGEQIQWLEQAGFADVDCMYKNLDFAVFFGRKAHE
jgi:tRNA (cmo5U34)-methyltransferase